MTDDEIDKLKAQLQEVKARASQLSGDVDRSKKEIGTRDKQIAALEAKVAENADLVEYAKSLDSKLRASEAALKSAQQLADDGKKAGKKVDDALALLGSP